MKVKFIQDEDFTNYKKCSMFIGTSECDFKCEKECGIKGICQNSPLVKSKTVEVANEVIIKNFLKNIFTEAVVIGGMEPMLSFEDTLSFVEDFRRESDADIVIYTGYYKSEIIDKIEKLKKYKNIIIKFGRFIPNDKPRYDEILGVTLISSNQYAEKL